LTDTLPFFPMYAAFPRSEYYNGSAPLAPSAGIAPIPPGSLWTRDAEGRPRAVPTFTVVRLSG